MTGAADGPGARPHGGAAVASDGAPRRAVHNRRTTGALILIAMAAIVVFVAPVVLRRFAPLRPGTVHPGTVGMTNCGPGEPGMLTLDHWGDDERRAGARPWWRWSPDRDGAQINWQGSKVRGTFTVIDEKRGLFTADVGGSVAFTKQGAEMMGCTIG